MAGAGTRLRPLTYTQPKPLIPVAGKPIISFIVDELRKAGVNEFIFIIGYLGEKIKDYLEGHYPDIPKTFIYQTERKGLGHAIWLAKEHWKNEDQLIIQLGDSILDLDLPAFIQAEGNVLVVKKVQDPRQFGVVEVNLNHVVLKAVEKPNIPKSNLALVGLYKISDVRFLANALDELITKDIRTYNEYQLTDAFMLMIEQHAILTTTSLNNWYDCGKKEILLDTNTMLLSKDDYEPNINSTPINSIIIHPVSIGKNCIISNAIIGPFATISDHAAIENSIVRESIIGNNVQLSDVVLYRSIIGNDSAIKGMKQSLNIGDNTEIDFS